MIQSDHIMIKLIVDTGDPGRVGRREAEPGRNLDYKYLNVDKIIDETIRVMIKLKKQYVWRPGFCSIEERARCE